jgi:hypothetical protein
MPAGIFVYNLYMAEIAPAQLRGKFVGSTIIWSASGVTLGQLTNFLVKQRQDGRVMISLHAGAHSVHGVLIRGVAHFIACDGR